MSPIDRFKGAVAGVVGDDNAARGSIENRNETEDSEPSGTDSARFPIVGVGASAGGLHAFEDFFSGMPVGTKPGMAFVLVQHLAPDHESILTELVGRYTHMEVIEVEDGMLIQPNCAYIIPPNREMTILNGALQLQELSTPRGKRLPIDGFFVSLAEDQGEHAIGIVLSGTGSDGTLGVRAIKGVGGMVMAQSPSSTEHDGMPRSAIATGLVDFELLPSEMPNQLMAYAAKWGSFSFPATPVNQDEKSLKKVFSLLRSETGHDFSQYKPTTVHRRIERRMAIHQIDTMEEYVKYLQQRPGEVEALFQDFLIGVTRFFRDAEAFKSLETETIPQLLTGKSHETVIRVWSLGCSTGEEAYSLAILFAERQEEIRQKLKIQVFASDIDKRAIAVARAGVYPASIAPDVSPERLDRFFVAEASHADGNPSVYRIRKHIRDMLIFSDQSVIKDPPFSKLDLICCRNLLIYMNAGLQKKIIPMFHYALKPGGFLFLGLSETIGEFRDLFTVLDPKAKVYRRKEDAYSARRMPHTEYITHPPSGDGIRAPRASAKEVVSPKAKATLREITERELLQQLSPASALIDAQGDILYLHGRTGMFLELAEGEFDRNILKMAREGLRDVLTTILHKDVNADKVERVMGLRVKTNGEFATVDLTIRPVKEDHELDFETPLYLVIMETARTVAPQPIEKPAASGNGREDSESRIAELERQLHAKDEYLVVTNEELESSNEQLRAANEELHSINEELQSTNEELETSKEELQSVNEELTTVNNELQMKVKDLSQANNDMNNLLAGTGIATIFVDHQLRILRFTPTITVVMNLISSDVGRPVAHIVSNLVGYDSLVADTQAVLDTLQPVELGVKTTEGKRFTMRIQPYRTLDNVIEGAVITFVDITHVLKAHEPPT